MSTSPSPSSWSRFDVGTAEGAAASRRGDRGGEGMSVAAARRIAQRAYERRVDASGEPCIVHAGRVAGGVPFARAVGWLHVAVERSGVDESVLVAAGASSEERFALRLLSGGERDCSDDAFVERARVIARWPGASGRIARAVKRADLLDHVSHRAARSGGVVAAVCGGVGGADDGGSQLGGDGFEIVMSATGSLGSGSQSLLAGGCGDG